MAFPTMNGLLWAWFGSDAWFNSLRLGNPINGPLISVSGTAPNQDLCIFPSGSGRLYLGANTGQLISLFNNAGATAFRHVGLYTLNICDPAQTTDADLRLRALLCGFDNNSSAGIGSAAARFYQLFLGPNGLRIGNGTNGFNLKAYGTSPNETAVVEIPGNGAFVAFKMPDGTGTGGNARGTNAVDFGVGAGDGIAARVASGTQSFRGPFGVEASGTGSVAFAGRATANYAFAANPNGSAAGEGSYAGGYRANASSYYSWAFGERANAYIQGASAFSSWDWGDRAAQRVTLAVGGKTTDATPGNLGADGTLNGAKLFVPDGTIWHGTMIITGSKSDGSAVALYQRQVAIKNVGGTTTLIGAVNTIGVDTAAGTAIAITADDPNDALQIQVTGIAAETWRWMARFDAVEIKYGT